MQENTEVAIGQAAPLSERIIDAYKQHLNKQESDRILTEKKSREDLIERFRARLHKNGLVTEEYSKSLNKTSVILEDVGFRIEPSAGEYPHRTVERVAVLTQCKGCTKWVTVGYFGEYYDELPAIGQMLSENKPVDEFEAWYHPVACTHSTEEEGRKSFAFLIVPEEKPEQPKEPTMGEKLESMLREIARDEAYYTQR